MENNEYSFSCNSEWNWNDKKEHGVTIQKQTLNLYRQMTTLRYGYPYFTQMECKKGDVKEAETYKKQFEQEVRLIKEKINKGNPNNQI